MPRVSPLQASFSGGLISKRALARTDIPPYTTAAEDMRNVLLMPEGGFMRRPGFRYVADTKLTTGSVRLIPFQFSTSQAYIIEVGDGYMRFFADQGQLVDGGASVEVATPWGGADISLLDWAQSADILYFAHPDFPPQKLSRISNTNWTLEEVQFLNGPFLSENVDDGVVITASATFGAAITLTGFGAQIFQPEHVGSVFRISESGGFLNAAPWAPNEATNFAQIRQSNGKIYQKTNAGSGNNGIIPPNHSRGTQNDGVDGTGNDWTFLNDGHGYATITGFTSGSEVTASVPADRPLPQSSTQPGGTSFFAPPAWSDFTGYPSVVTFANQRSVWGATRTQPSTFWMSAIGDFENFQGPGLAQATIDSSPIDRTLENSEGSVNTILWIAFKETLFMGTDGGVFNVRGSDETSVTPSNITARHVNSTRCSNVPAVIASSSIIFPRRSNRRLHELSFSFEFDSYDTPDLTFLAEDILKRGIVEMAWQDQPTKTLWMVDARGDLKSMLFDRIEGTVGWCEHDIRDADIESIASIPGNGATEDRDEVWVAVENANGRFIAFMERDWRSSEHSIDDVYYLDLMVTSESPVGPTLGGLLHLANQEVAIWGDGQDRARQVVTAAGEISLGNLGGISVLQIGLPIDWKYKSVRLDYGGPAGTALGKRRRIPDVTCIFTDTSDFKIGDNDSRLKALRDVIDREQVDINDAILDGDFKLPINSGFDGNRDPRIILASNGSGPFYMLAVSPTIQTSGA